MPVAGHGQQLRPAVSVRGRGASDCLLGLQCLVVFNTGLPTRTVKSCREPQLSFSQDGLTPIIHPLPTLLVGSNFKLGGTVQFPYPGMSGPSAADKPPLGFLPGRTMQYTDPPRAMQ